MPTAHLALVRRLYDAWSRGDFAGAAGLLDPTVKWESFREGQAVPEGPSGATWVFEHVELDLLAGTAEHAIAFTRRGQSDAERLEVWTVRNGRIARFRGYPREEGLKALTATVGTARLDTLFQALAAFNRRDVEHYLKMFRPDARLSLAPDLVYDGHVGLRRYFTDVDHRVPGARLDDVIVHGQSQHTIVVSAELTLLTGPAEPRHFVVAFQGDHIAWITAYPTAEQALAVAAQM